MEKKYRLGYDNVLLAHPPIEKGKELILGLALMIKYRLYDIESGLEILFNKKDQDIGKKVSYIFAYGNSTYADLGGWYLSNFLACSFDKNSNNYLTFKMVNTEILKQMGFRLEYEIVAYYKDILGEPITFENQILPCAEPQEIKKEEFYDIIKNNIENFDNEDNKIAQSTSYGAFLVEEENIENESYIVNFTIEGKNFYLSEKGCTLNIEEAKKYEDYETAQDELMKFLKVNISEQ